MECLIKHGAQMETQDNVSDEWYLSFMIDARVTKTLLYEYDIRMVKHHFILRVN